MKDKQFQSLNFGKPKEYLCKVHGIVTHNMSIHINNEIIINICLRCYADFLEKNVGMLKEIEPETERKDGGKQ